MAAVPVSERTEHGFRVGAIEAVSMMEYRGYAAVAIKVGDTEIVVHATPHGRRVEVSVDDGKASVQVARRRKGGHWE